MKILRLLSVIITLWVAAVFAQPAFSQQGNFPSSGGSSSPSSLTVFFNKYYGLSPLDTGAVGNGEYDNTCTTNSTTLVTCTAARFVCPQDAGKVYEVTNDAAIGTVQTGTGTIASCDSTSQVHLSASAPFTLASTAVMKWATDDTAGMRSWAAGISAVGAVHGGYLPKGTFYTTKPLRFVGPASSANDCNAWLTTVTGSSIGCGIWISGAGYTVSNIWPATAGTFNWAADGTSVNTAVMYFNLWSGGTLTQFSINGDNTAHNTTGQSGQVAGMMFDSVAHFYVNNTWVQGMHNTSNLLAAYMTTGAAVTGGYGPCAFESQFNPIIAESDDEGVWVCNQGAVAEKETYANGFLEGMNGPAVLLGNTGANFKQLRFDNMHFYCVANGANADRCFGFVGTPTTNINDSIVVANSRFNVTQGGPPMQAVVRMPPSAGLAMDFSNTYFETTNAATTYPLFLIPSGAHATIRVSGGALSSGNACASSCIVTNNDANSFVYIGSTGVFPLNSTDAFMFGGTSVANIASFHNTTSPLGVGFGTRGSVTSSQYGTLTNCAVNSVSPAACGSAASGAIVVPTGTTTYTVNTTAVTAASRISITPMSFAGNLPSAPTCVVPTTPFIATISAISAGTSFTMTLPNTTGQTCWQYQIEN